MTPLNPISRFTHWLWSVQIQDLPAKMAWTVRIGRVVHAVFQDASIGQLNLRAMSLVYTTLLSIVPLLAFSFSVLKGFGVHNQLEPILLRTLEPLGDRGPEVVNNILEFVDNIQVGVLGSVGLLLLVYTVYALLQKIEAALNEAWHIRRQRGVTEKFSNYLSVVLVGPVLVFSAVGVTASFSSYTFVERISQVEPFGTLMVWFSTLMPYFLVVAAFTFLYTFVPNTRVRVRAALTGALIAGLAWQTTGWIFAQVIAASARYTAIYSGFASLMFFIIWLYLTWLILLFGGKVSFYIQNPQFVTRLPAATGATHREKEELALSVMYLIGRSYLEGDRPWQFESLCRRLHVRGDVLEDVVARLESAGLILSTEGQSPGFLPGQDIGRMTLKRIRDASRGLSMADDPDAQMRHIPGVKAQLDALETMMDQELASKTLKDFLEDSRQGTDQETA
ncbi:membrane protein [Natronospira proteinivora]|uniref:Membrane protein n=1 Tax=Natronospira proteinivora TaxID=1807133 RepID=A0ABT1G8N6_9GAMM|nr:YihY/virulence factor BrkB family protein [Natronospira proteinivora]MCP1727667.1 membrane protein [Natronospira proteinivora]